MTATKLHISLDCSDLDASIAFYRELFGADPARREPDYAKFEVEDPPLALALNPGEVGVKGPSAHFGIRLGTAGEFAAARERLLASTLATREERAVTCCYAEQDKVWVEDPDGNAWEVYRVLGSADVHTVEPTACCDDSCCVAEEPTSP